MKDNQRIAVTKRMLQEGLLRLLKTEPIDKIKVVELCQESGINRATFYRHYSMPRDVLDDIRKGIFQDIRTLTRKEEACTNLQKSLEVICQYCYSHADVIRLLFTNQTDGGFSQLLNELYQEHLTEMQRTGQEWHVDPVDMKLASYYYSGGFIFILRQWLTENIDKTPTEIAALIYRFVSGKADR